MYLLKKKNFEKESVVKRKAKRSINKWNYGNYFKYWELKDKNI